MKTETQLRIFYLVLVIVAIAIFSAYLHRVDKDEKGIINKDDLTNITIQLKWVHQSQFAGIYVAKELGFYKEEGLSPTLIPFSFDDLDPIEKVANGSVNFGVTGASELITATSGKSGVKAIATIYKLSPFTLYSLKNTGIQLPSDLAGKRVGIQTGTDGDFLLGVLMEHAGLKESDITRVPIGYTADELITGDVDVSMGYIINEPQQAIEAGFEVNNMLMANYGATIYGDILIASDELIKEDPDLALRFLRATLKGWQYAIENPAETVPFVLKYAQDRPWNHEFYMLEESVPLIHTGDSPLGWMESEDWSDFNSALNGKSEVKNLYDMQFLNQIYN